MNERRGCFEEWEPKQGVLRVGVGGGIKFQLRANLFVKSQRIVPKIFISIIKVMVEGTSASSVHKDILLLVRENPSRNRIGPPRWTPRWICPEVVLRIKSVESLILSARESFDSPLNKAQLLGSGLPRERPSRAFTTTSRSSKSPRAFGSHPIASG
jgi:hypothetical protein